MSAEQVWLWVKELFDTDNPLRIVGIIIGGLTAVVGLIVNIKKMFERSPREKAAPTVMRTPILMTLITTLGIRRLSSAIK